MVSNVGTQACYDLLNVIEAQTQKPLTPESGEALHDALDLLEKLAEVATRVNIFAQDYLQQLHDQVVKLYGDVDSRVMEYEVNGIAKEAEELTQCPSLENLAAAVNALREHAKTFLDSFGPSMEQRRVIAMALERAEAAISGKELDMDEMAYLAAEAVLEEGLDDPQYARYLLKQLSKEARGKLGYYASSSQDIADFLHDIESARHDAPAGASQDKIVSFADFGIAVKA